jgi:hypothetical protein
LALFIHPFMLYLFRYHWRPLNPLSCSISAGIVCTLSCSTSAGLYAPFLYERQCVVLSSHPQCNQLPPT